MCVRNVNSYGCGCDYKEINECGRRCQPDIGYRFIREGDCNRCKSGGRAVTRGLDGRGRYAKAIQRRETKEEIQSVTGPVVDLNGEVTAWAQSPAECPADQTLTKGRHGRHRREADLAWQKEHESRMDDICSIAENLTLKSDSTPRPIPASTYRRSPSPIEVYSSNDEDHNSHRSRSSRKPLYGEVMSVADITGNSHTRHHRDYRSKYDSQDSLDSIPKDPRNTRRYEHFDAYDSGYGSHGSRRSHGSTKSHHSPRSITYTHSSSPHIYQSPHHYPYHQNYYPVERPIISLPRYSTY